MFIFLMQIYLSLIRDWVIFSNLLKLYWTMIFFLFEAWVLRFILIYLWKYFSTLLFSFTFRELIDIRFGFFGLIVYYPIFFSDIIILFNFQSVFLLLSIDQKLAWNLV